MNLAMGAKLLWRLVTKKKEWWKQSIWKKYFTGSRARCLDYPPKTTFGLSIFELLLETNLIISDNLNWISGNDTRISIWDDKILENDSQVLHASLLPVHVWLEEKGILTLSQLSQLFVDGAWFRCKYHLA
jgi:hypothetical protein